MKLKNVEAKFNLTTEIVLKSDIVKNAKVLNLDIDDVLDDYICDSVNLEGIYDLVEESLNSDLEIKEIHFYVGETLIDTYSDDALNITCECVVSVEEQFSENKNLYFIEEHLEDASFWFDKENITVRDYSLRAVVA